METPTLIYCGGNNKKFAKIAVANGFQYGCSFPSTVCEKLYFADMDWKNPKRDAYMKFLATHLPYMATILDLEKKEQYAEILSWAEEASSFVEVIIIIPKCHNVISKIPQTINGKEIRLGYSIPTKYGRTNVMLAEFIGWPIHLLGGSPHRQFELAHYLNVVSCDGNMIMKMATQKCVFFDDQKTTWRGYWPRLKDVGIETLHDAPYKAFELSCQNIIRLWKNG